MVRLRPLQARPDFYGTAAPENFAKFTENAWNGVLYLKVSYKIRTPLQEFSYEFYETFQNSYLIECLQTLVV